MADPVGLCPAVDGDFLGSKREGGEKSVEDPQSHEFDARVIHER